MKRKILFLGVVISIILLVGGVFFWWLKSNDTNRQKSGLEEVIKNVNVNNGDEVLNNKVEPNPEVLALRQEKYYIPEFEDRYLAYRVAREDWSWTQVVTYVNASRDKERYIDVAGVDFSKDVRVLIGKYHYLGTYEPDDLVELSSTYNAGSTPYLRREAAENFMKMADAARLEGLVLKNVSGYRSYATQEWLYNNYVARDGELLADTYSSKPGYSEHQAGLATDINSVDESFKYTNEYAWLQEHAVEYGFIMRYPEGLEEITGFSYEPWHYRYIGVDDALKMKAEGITFDEYYAYYIAR